MLERKKDRSQSGRTTADCADFLVEEVRQAIAWSRPSILIAVHASKNDQPRDMTLLEKKLTELSVKVEYVQPADWQPGFIRNMFRETDPDKAVIFIRDIGNQLQIYDELNMDRELIVDRRLKLIIWLTTEEIALLSHRSPDFWAFRHRVIEFPASRNSRRNALPSGVLLWPKKRSTPDVGAVTKDIESIQKLLESIPAQGETIVHHAQIVEDLAYHLWLFGEDRKVDTVLQQEIELVKQFNLPDILSLLLNIQAINCYDQSEYGESLRHIEWALELDPGRYYLWTNHGIICRSAGQSKKSISSLKKAVKLESASYESRAAFGYVHMSVGKYPAALSCFQEALALSPDRVHFLPALAFCCVQTNDTNGFNAALQKISDLGVSDDYFMICRDALSGDMSAAQRSLMEIAERGRISQHFVRRDPNLQFLFGSSLLKLTLPT
jgi:tetratricopeptide (TPR) repeat protein